jgi:hypothetical protein
VVGRDGAWIFASLERENRLCAIAHQMAAMREWLDRHRYARTRLVYDQTENALVISVEFPDDLEGEAFARRFDGQEPRQPLLGDLLCGEVAPPLLQPL